MYLCSVLTEFGDRIYQSDTKVDEVAVQSFLRSLKCDDHDLDEKLLRFGLIPIEVDAIFDGLINA